MMAQWQSAPRRQDTSVKAVSGETAQTAGLCYVADTQPGIWCQRCGKGFRYIGVDNIPVRNPEVLRRIKALLSRRPGLTSGFAHGQTGTSRLLAATPGLVCVFLCHIERA
jgi:hypothetical protein